MKSRGSGSLITPAGPSLWLVVVNNMAAASHDVGRAVGVVAHRSANSDTLPVVVEAGFTGCMAGPSCPIAHSSLAVCPPLRIRRIALTVAMPMGAAMSRAVVIAVILTVTVAGR